MKIKLHLGTVGKEAVGLDSNVNKVLLLLLLLLLSKMTCSQQLAVRHICFLFVTAVSYERL